ncbi:hypothetical protein CCACVL1_09671 [Corchorus capsularis]|uniref:Uncharacterized protein n=1 Tax=Corchorus capsularis TaxID=210143 RepID=A0A1R3IUM9_COCAP|nr:hypothetical protein CCACVL1_09671 [Corchorus capsularis]
MAFRRKTGEPEVEVKKGGRKPEVKEVAANPVIELINHVSN